VVIILVGARLGYKKTALVLERAPTAINIKVPKRKTPPCSVRPSLLILAPWHSDIPNTAVLSF
jgi:hypothetical protein